MGLLSSLTGADKAKDAAKASAQGQKDAQMVYQAAESAALANYTPYQDVGNLGANALQNVLASGNFDVFRADPGYQFALNEGRRAVDSSGAARGLNLSGAQLKGLTNYGQGMADQTYGNWFNRNLNLANMGLNTANSQGNVLMNAAAGKAGALTGAADAKASGYLAEGGIKNSLFNTAVGAGLTYATGGLGAPAAAAGSGASYTMPFNNFASKYGGSF